MNKNNKGVVKLMATIKEYIEEFELDKNNTIPESILDIDLYEPYFDNGIIDNRTFQLTGKTKRNLGKYKDTNMTSTFEYELIIDLNKIKLTLIREVDDMMSKNQTPTKEQIKEYLETLTIPVVTYRASNETFTHIKTYNHLGGVITHS